VKEEDQGAGRYPRFTWKMAIKTTCRCERVCCVTYIGTE